MELDMSSLSVDSLSTIFYNNTYSDRVIDLVESDFMSDVYNLQSANTLCVLN